MTARGVKPICRFQQVFKSTYLFGAFSPKDGHNFLLELPYCNTDSFQIFLDRFSEQRPQELKIIILDNAGFHKSKRLKIPDNILLIFLPPYSPELNPAEKIWARFKRSFTNRLMKTMTEISEFVSNCLAGLTEQIVLKTTRYEYINFCLNQTVLNS